MTKKRIKGGARLQDVATAAGVSNATVSAVVNGRAAKYGICRATQEKVQTLVRQMGYSPSLAALDMVAGRNSLVGVALSADCPRADHFLASLEPLLSPLGFRLVVAFLPPEPQAAAARITSLVQFGVAGMVVYPSDSMTLPRIDCPVIVVGRAGAGHPVVCEDERDGGRQLAGRLLDKGHRLVAILGGTMPQASAVSGFLETWAQVGATARIFNSAKEFMPFAGNVTAAFCLSSAALLELYSPVCGIGQRAGSDLAVVALDGLGVAAHLVPRPTVIQPGVTPLAQAVARLLQQVMQGVAPGEIRLAPAITEGDSIPTVVVKAPVVSVPVSQPVAPPPPVPVQVPIPVRPVTPPVLSVVPPPIPVAIPRPVTVPEEPESGIGVVPVQPAVVVPVVAEPAGQTSPESMPEEAPSPAGNEGQSQPAETPPETVNLPSETFQMPETVVSDLGEQGNSDAQESSLSEPGVESAVAVEQEVSQPAAVAEPEVSEPVPVADMEVSQPIQVTESAPVIIELAAPAVVPIPVVVPAPAPVTVTPEPEAPVVVTPLVVQVPVTTVPEPIPAPAPMPTPIPEPVPEPMPLPTPPPAPVLVQAPEPAPTPVPASEPGVEQDPDA